MRAVETLEAGVAEGTHVGAQLYVSHGGRVVVDTALGVARPDVPMTTDTLMTWFSMTKAVTSVAVAQLWERGLLDPEDPVVRHVPEFAPHGKHVITLRHLLTHTAGIPDADGMRSAVPWSETREENLARICAAPIEPDWEPGRAAGYHPAAGMSVLGEVVARVSGMPYERYVRDEIFLPLGMDDCWVGMPPERYRAYGDRIGWMHLTAGATGNEPPPRVARVDSERSTATPMPGANGRGPVRQLGRFYEMLLGRGERDGVRLLGSPTVAAVSARHRVGMVDRTFGIALDWGLGFAIDTYVMGRHSSPRAFGHGGHLSSAAFCDPEHGVVVAVVCNGMPDADRHHRRMDAIATAVYEDLGVARPDAAGRRKPYPVSSI